MRIVAIMTILLAILVAAYAAITAPSRPDTSSTTRVAVAARPIKSGDTISGMVDHLVIPVSAVLPGMIVIGLPDSIPKDAFATRNIAEGDVIYRGHLAYWTPPSLKPLSDDLDLGSAAVAVPLAMDGGSDAPRSDREPYYPVRYDLVFRDPADPSGASRRIEWFKRLANRADLSRPVAKRFGLSWLPDDVFVVRTTREHAREVGWALLSGATDDHFSFSIHSMVSEVSARNQEESRLNAGVGAKP